jgi:hypothetical protein
VAFARLQTTGASGFILMLAPNFDLEGGDSRFIQNHDTGLPNHTASHTMKIIVYTELCELKF